MAIGSNLAGVARVAFVADTGEFNRDISQAQARYAQTTGKMSDDALRMSLAQDKLNRALNRFGPESKQAASATLALRSAQRQGAAESGRLTTSVSRSGRAAREAGHGFNTFRRDVDRAAAGAILGTRAFHGLRQGLLLGGSSLLGGFGATFALEKVLTASKEAQVAQGQLRVALKNTGNSWSQYGVQVTDALDKQTRTSAFSNDELASSLSVFVRRFGDVNQALRANALAAEVARGKNIGLAKAQDTILKASFGNPRAAKSLGVEVGKVTTAYDRLKATTQRATSQQIAFAKAADTASTRTQILAAIQQKFHGNAARFLTTSAGKQALFNAELRHSEEIIGGALLPAFNKILGSLSKYLERMNRTGRLQRDVNEAVKVGTQAVRGLKNVFSALHAVLGPLNRLLGGTKNTTELLAVAFAALKLRKVAIGFGLIGSAAKTAAIAEAGVGTAAVAAEGEVAVAAAGMSAALAPLLITLGGVAFLFQQIRADSKKTKIVGPVVRGSGSGGQNSVIEKDGEFYRLTRTAGRGSSAARLTKISASEAASITNTSTGAENADAAAKRRSGQGQVANTSTRLARRRAAAISAQRKVAPPGDPTVIPFAIQQMLADAGLTPRDQSDDRKAFATEAAFIRKQLATAKLTKTQRIALTQQLGSDISQIQSIDDQAAAARKAAADKVAQQRATARRKEAEAARKARAAKERAARERRQEARRAEGRREGVVGSALEGFRRRLTKAEATETNNDDLAVLGAERRYLVSEIKNKELQLSFRRSLERKRDSLDAQINRTRKKKHAGLTDLTGRQQQAFIGELSGVLGQFASNVTANGSGGGGVTIVQHLGPDKSSFAAMREARLAAAHVL